MVLSTDVRQIIDALLLSGGSLIASPHSAFYTQASLYYDYLQWVSEKLSEKGIDQRGRVVGRRTVRGSIIWRYASYSYHELRALRNVWYSDLNNTETESRKFKELPDDFEFSRETALFWYLNRGHLILTRYYNGRYWNIRFFVGRFSEESVQRLTEELRSIGCRATAYVSSQYTSYINITNPRRFLNYIGPCPQKLIHIVYSKNPSYGAFSRKWDMNR